jgi:hypothetical protein
VPTLKPAWNRGMIDRPAYRSAAAPWTFIATSQAPVPKPIRNRPTTTGAVPIRNPAATTARPTQSSSAIAATVRREPMRWITVPDRGRASTEPAATESSTRPSAAGSSSSRSRIWGIRAAQLAKAKPAPMNATDVARTAARTAPSP